MITILTDFGTADYFVPAVKGVIHSLCPNVEIVDVTHQIPVQDIAAASFTLGACFRNFPIGTIHVAVVDPGVGSLRRAIIVEADGHFFVGPDNGIFSAIFAQEKNVRIFQIERSEFFWPTVSPTFHGRDMFAPIAAWLAKGVTPEAMGTEILDPIRLAFSPPQITKDCIVGEVIHIDHFGNCITNLTATELPPHECTEATSIKIAEYEVRQFGTHFAQSINAENLLAYLGSAGFWEIAMWQDSAAEKLQINRGAVVQLQR